MALDPQKIEDRIDLVKAGAMVVSDNMGGVMFQNMTEVMEFSKLLSLAGTAIPKHLRNNPGGCLAVTIQALEWRSSPIAVANKSYEVNDRIAYEAQMIVAVINSRAPLQSRLRYKYEGDGVEMKCTVSGLMKGEATPLEYTSPTISKIKVKNSPLWTADPEQQLGYYSARAWARRHCPEVLLGIYSEEELRDGNIGPENARDITPSSGLKDRLKGGGKDRGFDKDHIDRTLVEHKPGETIDVSAAPKAEPVAADAKPAVDPAQPEMTISAGDAETEIKAKLRAIQNANTREDVAALVDGAKAFLKEQNRPDLLNEVLTAQRAREKQIKTGAVQTAG